VLDLGQTASGMLITMHDLRRVFAGEIAVDALADENGNKKGDYALVKMALNHAAIKSDVTQGYIMVNPKLKMLRPIFLAHERRVLSAAGLEHLLPKDPKLAKEEDAMNAMLKRAKDDPKFREQLKAALAD
jgi:hypothetical protein